MHKYWMVHKFVGGNTPTKIHATKAEAMEKAEPVAWLVGSFGGDDYLSFVKPDDAVFVEPLYIHPHGETK